MPQVESAKMKRIVRNVLTRRPDDMGCTERVNRVDRFVEMELEGKDAVEAMPRVEDHLTRCLDCREEFLALLETVHHL